MAETKPSENPAAPIEKAIADGTGTLEKRIEAVINEYVQKAVSNLEKNIDTMISNQLAAKEIEVEKALRKGLGLENDPAVHQSDLIAAIRKATLENAEKRSPAASTKASGPEGNQPSDPIDKMFNAYEVKA